MNSDPLVVPIFPLPNVVFFPHTFLPLHVFEPRYRAMVADALEADRLIAVVLAHEERPPEARPVVHRIGSVGGIRVAEPLEGGRYDIVLEGISRARLGSLAPRPGDYYVAEVEFLGEALPDLQDPEVAERKAAFLLTARRYGEQVLCGEMPTDLVSESAPYPTLVNRVASLVKASVGAKQALLDLDDVGTRARTVERWMEEQIASHAAINAFRDRRPEDVRRN